MWELVTTVGELRQASPVSTTTGSGSRKQLIRLSTGRGIVLFYHKNRVTAMDHGCYHHGGPLADGDIEDLQLPSSTSSAATTATTSCIICPWHKYYISLDTGECLYKSIDIHTKAQSWKSKGMKQRVHGVKIVEKGGGGAREGGQESVSSSSPSSSSSSVSTSTTTTPSADPASMSRQWSDEALVYVADLSKITSESEVLALDDEATTLLWRRGQQQSQPQSQTTTTTSSSSSSSVILASDAYALLPFNSDICVGMGNSITNSSNSGGSIHGGSGATGAAEGGGGGRILSYPIHSKFARGEDV